MRNTRDRAESDEMRDVDTETGVRTSRRGFGGYNKLNQTTFRVEDNSEIIAFLEPENFTYALRHWIKYVDAEGKPATRTEWCIEDECPVCEIGDKPKAVCFFNVVDMANPGKVLVWEASSDPTDKVQKEYNKLAKLPRPRNLNDADLYWVVSKEKGKNGFYTYSVDKLTEEGLLEEWTALRPLTPEQRTALGAKLYTETYVEYKERSELQDFVDSLG